MRRFVPTLAAIVAIVLCVLAGNWQRARMHYKEGLKAQYEAASAAPALRGSDLPEAPGDWGALRYRPVLLDGTFDARRQFFLDNKVHAGQVGYDVVAPLELATGRVILIDRGWVPQGASRAVLPEVPPPGGSVTVPGRLELPARYFELQANAPAGALWQHLDVARLRAATGLDLLPVIVQQTRAAGPGDDLVRDWPAPDFGIDTHRIYMVQWYIFALLALVFWVVAHWRRRPAPAEAPREVAHG